MSYVTDDLEDEPPVITLAFMDCSECGACVGVLADNPPDTLTCEDHSA